MTDTNKPYRLSIEEQQVLRNALLNSVQVVQPIPHVDYEKLAKGFEKYFSNPVDK